MEANEFPYLVKTSLAPVSLFVTGRRGGSTINANCVGEGIVSCNRERLILDVDHRNLGMLPREQVKWHKVCAPHWGGGGIFEKKVNIMRTGHQGGREVGGLHREPPAYIPRQPPRGAGKRSTQTLPRDRTRPLTRDVSVANDKKLPSNHLPSFPSP